VNFVFHAIKNICYTSACANPAGSVSLVGTANLPTGTSPSRDHGQVDEFSGARHLLIAYPKLVIRSSAAAADQLWETTQEFAFRTPKKEADHARDFLVNPLVTAANPSHHMAPYTTPKQMRSLDALPIVA